MFQPTEKDRQWLAWALDLAEDAMLGEPDEFDDSDFAALEAWKAVASAQAHVAETCDSDVVRALAADLDDTDMDDWRAKDDLFRRAFALIADLEARVRAGGGTVSCAPENAGRNQP